MADTDLPKLYYSIGEVSRMTSLDTHVLRYWETEFRDLSPRKNRGGKRLYRDSDLKIIFKIKELLYEQRYTIEGAKKALKTEGQGARNLPDVTRDSIGDRLQALKQGLLEIKELLSN
jgi:DNA-binding transcriptional MerR regulator